MDIRKTVIKTRKRENVDGGGGGGKEAKKERKNAVND